VPTATSGTFYVANGGAGDVLKVNVTGLNKNDIYIAVGSDNAIDQLDTKTGQLTPFITGLNSPAGLMFIPSASPSAAPGTSPAAPGAKTTPGDQSGFAGLINASDPNIANEMSPGNLFNLGGPASSVDPAAGSDVYQGQPAAGLMAASQIDTKLNALFSQHSATA